MGWNGVALQILNLSWWNWGSITAPLPDRWLCGGYVLPMCSHVDRNHMGAHRQHSRGTQGAEGGRMGYVRADDT